MKKKTLEELKLESLALDEAIAEEEKIALKHDEKRQIEEKIAEKKKKLAELKDARDQSFYKRIKKKTSPVLRSLEKKFAKNIPKVMDNLSKIGEASYNITQGTEKEEKAKKRSKGKKQRRKQNKRRKSFTPESSSMNQKMEEPSFW